MALGHFTNAHDALPHLGEGDGLGWDNDASVWRIYALTDGTGLEPELFRLGGILYPINWTGAEILRGLESKT